jgi:hypothetical protein
MPSEAAFGVPHPRGQRRQRLEQGQLRRRQQRRLPDLAADLEHEPGVQHLPAPGVRPDQAPALGDAHVGGRAGPMVDEPLQRVTVGQALVHHDLGRRIGHQPGQAGQVAAGDRLLEGPDPDRAELTDGLQGLFDGPGHVGVDPEVDPAAEQPPSRPGRRQGPLAFDLQLDVPEPEGAQLEQRHRMGPSLAGGHHPAVAEPPQRVDRRWRPADRHRFAGRPPERVQQGQVDAAPGRRLRDLGIDPLGGCLAVAFLEERDEVGKRLEPLSEQRRQDGVTEQGEGSLATLAGDIRPRERLPPALGAAVQPDAEEQALGGGPRGRGVPDRDLEGKVDREQPQLGHRRH